MISVKLGKYYSSYFYKVYACDFFHCFRSQPKSKLMHYQRNCLHFQVSQVFWAHWWLLVLLFWPIKSIIYLNKLMQLSPCSKIHIFMHVISPCFRSQPKGKLMHYQRNCLRFQVSQVFWAHWWLSCVIVLTNKIYNLSEQIDAIVSLFSNSMVVTDHREFYMFLLVWLC